MATATEGHEHTSSSSFDRKSNVGGGKFLMRAARPAHHDPVVHIRKLAIKDPAPEPPKSPHSPVHVTQHTPPVRESSHEDTGAGKIVLAIPKLGHASRPTSEAGRETEEITVENGVLELPQSPTPLAQPCITTNGANFAIGDEEDEDISDEEEYVVPEITTDPLLAPPNIPGFGLPRRSSLVNCGDIPPLQRRKKSVTWSLEHLPAPHGDGPGEETPTHRLEVGKDVTFPLERVDSIDESELDGLASPPASAAEIGYDFPRRESVDTWSGVSDLPETDEITRKASVCAENDVTGIFKELQVPPELKEEDDEDHLNESSTSLEEEFLSDGDEGGLSPDSNDAELDAIQNSSPNLNNEASKQKVILRQKGSLAKRRKPSRNSLRVQSADCDHYADALADELDQSRSNEDSSADEKGDRCKDGEEEQGAEEDGGEKSEEDGETGKVEMHAHEEGERQAVTSPPPDPVLLPGLGQTVKLKKSKSVSDAEPATGSSQPEVIDLSKIHLRKTHSVDTPTPTTGSDSAAPGDDEENQSNTFGAQPDWLKEARAKKKRVAEKFTEDADKKDKVGEDDPGPSPWLKDRKLRKVTAPTPFKVYSNVEESHILNATSHSPKASTPAKAPHLQRKTEVKHTDNPDKQLKHSINESVKSGENEIIIRKDLASREVVITSKQAVKSPPPSVDTDMHVNNQHTPEAPPSKVSSPAVMSPTSVSPPESAEQSHGVTPSWKLEIENRKKTKYFVPSQKPKAPLRLGETPQWKRDLMERNKQRSKHSSPGPDDITTEIGWKKGDTSDEADGKS